MLLQGTVYDDTHPDFRNFYMLWVDQASLDLYIVSRPTLMGRLASRFQEIYINVNINHWPAWEGKKIKVSHESKKYLRVRQSFRRDYSKNLSKDPCFSSEMTCNPKLMSEEYVMTEYDLHNSLNRARRSWSDHLQIPPACLCEIWMALGVWLKSLDCSGASGIRYLRIPQ